MLEDEDNTLRPSPRPRIKFWSRSQHVLENLLVDNKNAITTTSRAPGCSLFYGQLVSLGNKWFEGDIADKRYHVLRSMLLLHGLSVRRYRHGFFCTRKPLCPPERCQDLAGISQPFTPQILPQSDPAPVDFSVGDIRWQIAAEWLERQWIGDHHRSFTCYRR